MDKRITVCMLGELSLRWGDICVSERSNRSKEWELIAYVIVNRHREISRDELLKLLVGYDDVQDPGNSFRKILWRARKALEPLAAALNEELIIYKKSRCLWSTEVELQLDIEVFERLCKFAFKDGDDAQRLAYCRSAIGLYRGAFVPKLSGEAWWKPLAGYYHSLFTDLVMNAVPLLSGEGFTDEAVDLCKRAITESSYDEELYRLEMQTLMEAGETEGAIQVYREMANLFSSELDVTPSPETQNIYFEALRQVGGRQKPLEQIIEQLREAAMPSGPRICDFSTFRLFYQMEARSVKRRGDVVHIGILTLHPKKGKAPTDKMLERAMQQLSDQIYRSLRIGDIAASCSASQYILLLVQADFENSQMVCRRVERAFVSNNPNSPFMLSIDVAPLEPTDAIL